MIAEFAAAAMGGVCVSAAEVLRRHVLGRRLEREVACQHPSEAGPVALGPAPAGSGHRRAAQPAPPSAA